MAIKKTVDLRGLVATKGTAYPAADMPSRSLTPASGESDPANNIPLNFRSRRIFGGVFACSRRRMISS